MMSTDTAADRRTAALHRARAEDTARKHQSVLDTLQRLADNGIRVTFELVARRAGVSRQFLYGDSALRAAVEEARQRPPTAPRRDPAPNDGDGLRTDLLLAREEIQRLRSQNTKIKAKLIERVADEVLDEQEETATRLVTRNAELVRETATLRRQLAAAQQDLDASRATNRDLMTELNRRQPRRD